MCGGVGLSGEVEAGHRTGRFLSFFLAAATQLALALALGRWVQIARAVPPSVLPIPLPLPLFSAGFSTDGLFVASPPSGFGSGSGSGLGSAGSEGGGSGGSPGSAFPLFSPLDPNPNPNPNCFL